MDARFVSLPKIVKHATLDHTYSFQFLDVRIENFTADLPMLQRLLREMYTRVHRQYYHSSVKYEHQPINSFFVLMLAPLYGKGTVMRQNATKEIEQLFVGTLTQTQAANNLPMPDALLQLITEDIYTLDVSHEELYFAPFLQSRVFILAFVLMHFGNNDGCDVVSYWNANPDPIQFTRDLCYFIALRFDESIVYALDPFRYNTLRDVWADIDKTVTEQELAERRGWSHKPDSEKVEKPGSRGRGASRRLARTEQNLSMVREIRAPWMPLIQLSAVQLSRQFKAKMMYIGARITHDLLPLIIPLCPEECQRDNKLDFWKLRLLAFIVPYILRQRLKLFFDIASQYSAISMYHADVDVYTPEGVCMYAQFFTETHMDMIAAELKRYMGQTWNEALLSSEFEFDSTDRARPYAMAGMFNHIAHALDLDADVDDD